MDTLVDLEVSFSQARIVFVLARFCDPVPIHELADAVRMSVASTGRNVDSLVTHGLVARTEDQQDRRVRLVALSDTGQAFTKKHVDAKRQSLRAFTERLPFEDRERLCAALEPILAGDSLQSHAQEKH